MQRVILWKFSFPAIRKRSAHCGESPAALGLPLGKAFWVWNILLPESLIPEEQINTKHKSML